MRLVLFILILLFAENFVLGQLASTDRELREKAKQSFLKARHMDKDYGSADSIFICLVNAKEYLADIEYDSLLFFVNNHLIYWYKSQNESHKGFLVCKENLALSEKNKNPFWRNASHLNFADYYLHSNSQIAVNRDSVMYYCSLVLKEAERTNDLVHYIVAANTLASYHLENNINLSKVPELLLPVLEYEKTNEETKLQANLTKAYLGWYYLEVGDYAQAMSTLEPLRDISGELGFLRWIEEFLAQSYKAQGDYKEAYLSSQKINFFADSLASQNRHEAIQKAKYSFETNQKEKLIQQLEENAQLREQTTSRLQSFNKMILLALFLILGLSVLLIRNYVLKRNADKALIKTQDEMAKMKARLFTNITHEFRTPLTVIMGMVNRIKGNPTEKELIQRNSQQLLDMVNQMLDLSKNEVGLLELKMIQSDFIGYLRYLTESHENLAIKKNIKLAFYCEENELVMDFDSKQIKHIVSNLISNAIKFTKEDGQIIVHVKRQQNEIIVKIKDNGIGIDAKYQPHIFDRFYQVDDKSENIIGTGLGLAFVKELVDLMQGSIHVESSQNVGTTFTIVLPISNNMDFEFLATGVRSEEVSNKFLFEQNWTLEENLSIALVIEDNEDVQTYIDTCIGSDYIIKKAKNGKEGVGMAFEFIPDIIISDVMMPEMDGYQVTKALKEDFKTSHIPIILLTAKATNEDRITGLDMGADAFLTKPFNEEELKIRMSKLIALRKKLQHRYKNELSFQEDVKVQDPFMVRLLKVVNENFTNEEFGTKELAQAMNLSRMQVHRKIKALTNSTTSNFMNQFRLEKAFEQIHDNNMNISEIAYANGFSDPSYFSKLFTKKFGRTPSEARS